MSRKIFCIAFAFLLAFVIVFPASAYNEGGDDGTATFATKLSAIYKVRDDAKGIYNRFTGGTETVFSVSSARVYLMIKR